MTHDQTTPAPVEVTQADRDRAAKFISESDGDFAELAALFAAHRIAHSAPAGEVVPVAWMYERNGKVRMGLDRSKDMLPAWTETPLYAGKYHFQTRPEMRRYQGHEHIQAKLTFDQVQALRADTRPHSVIAREYGLDRSTVSRIKRFEAYKNVPTNPVPPADLVELVEALREAREALHFHYVEWDGEPEDAVPLQLARAKCDAALAKHGGA